VGKSPGGNHRGNQRGKISGGIHLVANHRGKSLASVERVTTMKILGVTLRDDINASMHITQILGECSRSMYALRILRSHGLPTAALHEVTRATTLAKLMYAATAWWGFARAVDRAHIDSFIRRTCRIGCLPRETPDFTTFPCRIKTIKTLFLVLYI